MYSPESEYKVFCTSCYNDREDCTIYGIDFNFSKNFLEQFSNLFKKVPRLLLAHKNNNAEGCDYANYAYRSRNAYLSFNIVRSENIYYSKYGLEGNKICLDSYNIKHSERGYELFFVSRIYNSRFLVRSSRCIDSAFLFDCSECNNCFMSYNLRNKSYVLRNKQLTREKYLEKIKEFPLDSYIVQEKLKKEFSKLPESALCRPAMVRSIENCTGDFIGHSKNTHYSFSVVDAEDSKYIVFGTNTIRDSYDLLFIGRGELCYELANSGAGNNNSMFSLDIGTVYDSAYCISCLDSKKLFGCVGLKNKQYCILNKQYTKEEYKKLVPKIVEQMNEMPYIDKEGRVYKYGEFFPPEFSPFAYNESLAYEEFPISKERVEKEGYLWRDEEEKHYDATIQSQELPDSINDVKENILEEIIACPNKGKIETKCTFAYRIVPDELRFYQLMKIPLPRYCPNCRYYERRKWKNPWKLWHRKCMCGSPGSPSTTTNHFHGEGRCKVEFETSYAPKRPEIVYCEKCYQSEVY